MIGHLNDGQVDDYPLGRLTPDEQLALEEHLLHCQRCQKELELTDRMIGALRAFLKSREPKARRSGTLHVIRPEE